MAKTAPAPTNTQKPAAESAPILYVGATEEERTTNAIIFDRLTNILERFGESYTPSERNTLQFVMRERIILVEGEPAAE